MIFKSRDYYLTPNALSTFFYFNAIKKH